MRKIQNILTDSLIYAINYFSEEKRKTNGTRVFKKELHYILHRVIYQLTFYILEKKPLCFDLCIVGLCRQNRMK